MKVEVFADADSVMRGADATVAAEASAAVAVRGGFVRAVSGTRTPGAIHRKHQAGSERRRP